MAGAIGPEGGISGAGVAAQEAGQPQVEYFPFSDLAPERLADLTGGELQEPLSFPDPLMRTIKAPGWFMHWNSENPEVGRVSTIRPFGLMGDREGVEFELDQTVAVVDPADPESVIFVHPRNIHHRYSTPLFDWVRVSRDEISIERALERSTKVTDQIRNAAQMAYQLESERVPVGV